MPGTTHGKLGLTWGWSPHEAGWGDGGFNPDMAILNTLVQCAIISRVAAPPGSPADDDAHIVIATGSGAFTGHEGDVAVWDDGDSAWVFYTPSVGWRVWDLATNSVLRWSGTAWLGEKYIIGASVVSGVLTAAQVLLYHKFAHAVDFIANFAGALGDAPQAAGSANATASTACKIQKAVAATPTSFSDIGTITFATGTVTPTFAGSAVSFAQGDVIRIIGPASADATFADFFATLVGFQH